jgi:hypothetical protein
MPFIISVTVVLLTSTAYLLHQYRTRALIPGDSASDDIEDAVVDAGDRDLKAA